MPAQIGVRARMSINPNNFEFGFRRIELKGLISARRPSLAQAACI